MNGFNEALASDALKRFREIGEELRLYLFERDEAIRVVMIAFLIRHNVIFVSAPGTAKSSLLNLVCRSIEGAKYFKIQLYKQTGPEFVFGPLDFRLLREGVQRHRTEGYLPEANFALVDEFFSSNSGVLVGLGSMLHPEEREFSNGEGGEPMKCPIHSIVAGTNYVPDLSAESEDIDLSKIYERFLFRVVLSALAEEENFLKLLTVRPPKELSARITLSELEELQKFVPQVIVGEEIKQLVSALRRKFGWDKSPVSDRRWPWGEDALRGSAFLAERDTVLPEDLLTLQHILWTHPDDQRKTKSMILEVVFPNFFEALKDLQVAENLLKSAESSSVTTEKRREQPIEIEKTREKVAKLLTDKHTRAGFERQEIEKILQRIYEIRGSIVILSSGGGGS